VNRATRSQTGLELPLHESLGLGAGGELVSIVGGGGKSALLFALAERSTDTARWVLSTTTRIFAAQIELAPAWCTSDSDTLAAQLEQGPSGLLVIGEVDGEKAVGVSPELPREILAHPHVDHVAVEADGSRRLPTKAPAEHEPVIATGTTLTVVVAGIDALEGSIAERAHRPERVAAITGRSPDAKLTPSDLATLLASKDGGLKGVPDASRVVVLLNKVETPEQSRAARVVAAALRNAPRIDRVSIGALQSDRESFETWLRDPDAG
jgi:molybdenum cofactor cytidylyltransferase